MAVNMAVRIFLSQLVNVIQGFQRQVEDLAAVPANKMIVR